MPDGFDTVDELYSLDEFGQLVMPVEAAPALLGRLGEREDHGERGLVGEATLRAHGSMPHGGKAADRMGLEVRRCFQCSAGKS